MAVVLETSIGDITVDLYLKERPRCCLNFLKLCKLKKYNYNLFHTIQQNFIAQTGDPTGTGKGGESVFQFLYGDQATFFEAEVKPRIKHLKKGAVSMVNNGTNMHGSQFFITLCENLDYLDDQLHTVFGEVSEGFDILDRLNEVITDKDNRPYKEIRIFHTVVLDDPIPDPPGMEGLIPQNSPSPLKETLDKIYIGVDESIEDTTGLTAEEAEERKKEREAQTNAKLLEMIGDLPDADIAPPENVLFVCKLNSVTTAEDLEVIFSRFGPIESCEVIKDQKTGESLQYAFIEFKNEEDCEKAYFKMDNVLIDDRRIHVDFSQSVSKLKFPTQKIVDEKKLEEPAQPKFLIKDPDARSMGNYEFVFDDNDNVQGKDNLRDRDKSRNKKGHKDDESIRHKKGSKDKKHKSNSLENLEYHRDDGMKQQNLKFDLESFRHKNPTKHSRENSNHLKSSESNKDKSRRSVDKYTKERTKDSREGIRCKDKSPNNKTTDLDYYREGASLSDKYTENNTRREGDRHKRSKPSRDLNDFLGGKSRRSNDDTAKAHYAGSHSSGKPKRVNISRDRSNSYSDDDSVPNVSHQRAKYSQNGDTSKSNKRDEYSPDSDSSCRDDFGKSHKRTKYYEDKDNVKDSGKYNEQAKYYEDKDNAKDSGKSNRRTKYSLNGDSDGRDDSGKSNRHTINYEDSDDGKDYRKSNKQAKYKRDSSDKDARRKNSHRKHVSRDD